MLAFPIEDDDYIDVMWEHSKATSISSLELYVEVVPLGDQVVNGYQVLHHAFMFQGINVSVSIMLDPSIMLRSQNIFLTLHLVWIMFSL